MKVFLSVGFIPANLGQAFGHRKCALGKIELLVDLVGKEEQRQRRILRGRLRNVQSNSIRGHPFFSVRLAENGAAGVQQDSNPMRAHRASRREF